MDDIERLLAIEEIKQLKARYFLYLDTHDWDNWRDQVWAPDARLEVPEMNRIVEPRDQLIDWLKEIWEGVSSVHHGHMPIIEITSDTTATGLWAMEDIVARHPDSPEYSRSAILHGYGHYHETYVKLEQGWRIRSTKLTRLRAENKTIF